MRRSAARALRGDAPARDRGSDLDPPGKGEVLVRIRAAGLCHSDLSVIDGNRPRPMPMVLGHEAAGVVEEVGPGITHLQRGDHVVAAFVPSCGHCIPCATGRPALCEPGFKANTAGTLLSGERRLHDSHGTVNHHLGCRASPSIRCWPPTRWSRCPPTCRSPRRRCSDWRGHHGRRCSGEHRTDAAWCIGGGDRPRRRRPRGAARRPQCSMPSTSSPST